MIDPAAIRRSRLDNGLTVISERIETVRTVSLGVWSTRGSRDEAPERNGITHFVEHMLFKGTATRSNRDIAFETDAMGGQLDAFTSKESTAYWAQVLDEALPQAFDLLADLVRHPRLDPDDVEREREVILEEIAEAEDDPEDLLYESFHERFWAGHPMGRPILGTPATVGSFSQPMIQETVESVAPGDLMIAAAGNLQHEQLEALAREAFGHLPARPAGPERIAPRACPHLMILEREQLEQVQLYVACVAPPIDDPERYSVHLLNTLLGGGVSSRLFQVIREERGLAYSIYSSVAPYSDCGYLMVSAGTRPTNAALVVELILEQLGALRAEPITADELHRMKDHLKGALMLSLENTFGRMANLARQQTAFGRTFSLDEILAGIDAVTVESVLAAAQRLFGPDGALSVGMIARRDVAEELRRQFADGGLLAAAGASS